MRSAKQRRTGKQLICPQCQRRFVTYRSPKQWPLHCSKRCVGVGLKRSGQRRCLTCGKSFRVGKTEKHAKSVTHCSHRCRQLDQPVLCNSLTAGQAGYLAGLLDGEGSIVPLKRTDGTIKSYRLHIVNTYLPVVHWCKEITGLGTTTERHTVPPKISLNPRDPEAWRRYKTVGSWSCYGVKAASVLRRLLPYLQIKKEKAQAALKVMHP